MQVHFNPWGKLQGKDVYLVEANHEGIGLRMQLSNFGATLVRLDYALDDGSLLPVVYPLATLGQYLEADYYPGAIIGRYANRIGGAAFGIGNQIFKLSENGQGYSLHGGAEGFSHRVWDLVDYSIFDDEAIITFRLFSPDGDQGFPGNLSVTAMYHLSAHRLMVNYQAETDQPTHVNLTTHGYFNLSGFGQGVHHHQMTIQADKFLEVDERIVATGEMTEVAGSAFDFRKAKTLEQGMQQLGDIFNHCLVLSHPGLHTPAATVFCPSTGMQMKVTTTQPGFQLYTPIERPSVQHPDLPVSGIESGQPWAFCLEPQHLPNTPNIAHFPSTLLLPGQKYQQTTIFEFSRKY
ncbi:MAG: aldose epimerase family protein [Bacteroidales bacterium]